MTADDRAYVDDYLAKVEAERDALRAVLREVLVYSWECSDPAECDCSHARAARLLGEVGS